MVSSMYADQVLISVIVAIGLRAVAMGLPSASRFTHGSFGFGLNRLVQLCSATPSGVQRGEVLSALPLPSP